MDVPRYLFRSHSPNSDGTNSITGFGSMAKSNGNNRIRSLSRMAPAAAHGMLKDHVLWHSWKDRDDDILISFTPSFLFSLQHCVRKINGGRQTTKHNCYITIIDTSRFPLHTFTWTVDLLEQYDLDIKNDPNLLHKYHEAEYVAEYELLIIDQEAAKTVSFNELDLRGDLFDIMPELDDEIYKGKLWLRLQQLRRQWYREEKAITSFEVHGARKLALCFGGKWVPPMMLWALAIRARPNQNQMLIHEFREGFYGRTLI
jgi:hypothetical protein